MGRYEARPIPGLDVYCVWDSETDKAIIPESVRHSNGVFARSTAEHLAELLNGGPDPDEEAENAPLTADELDADQRAEERMRRAREDPSTLRLPDGRQIVPGQNADHILSKRRDET